MLIFLFVLFLDLPIWMYLGDVIESEGQLTYFSEPYWACIKHLLLFVRVRPSVGGSWWAWVNPLVSSMRLSESHGIFSCFNNAFICRTTSSHVTGVLWLVQALVMSAIFGPFKLRVSSLVSALIISSLWGLLMLLIELGRERLLDQEIVFTR